MTVVVLTVGFFAIAMAAMALGVILSNRRLHGSCGGVGGDDCLCEIEKRRACHHHKHAQPSGDGGVVSAAWLGRDGTAAGDGRA